MIIIHALWTDATLHLWGEKQHDQREDDPYPSRSCDSSFSRDSSGYGRTAEPLAMQPLKRTLGDLWDSLLVSGALCSQIDLLLPHRNGLMRSSRSDEACPEPAGESERSLQRVTVDVLSFTPADAVDLLTTPPVCLGNGFQTGASLRYWARVADLVLELLAKQRFVPAVHLGRAGDYRGLWRVVVGDKETSQRLRALIAAMPPVCRGEASGTPWQAATLVENFLWTTVDELVRRCLEQDELTHALQDRSGGANSALMRWLRSLVHPDPALSGSTEEQQSAYATARRWLAELDPGPEERTCRTCFRLDSPDAGVDGQQSETERSWLLSFQIQAVRDPSLIVDATRLVDGSAADPQILPRPFVNALEQLRADLSHAARHFPPLASCAEPTGPLQCPLTLNEAHRFLKDTAPVLKAEGYTVTMPSWWHERRPGLRMQLDIRPAASPGEAGTPTMQLDSLVAYDWRVALGDEALSTEEITRLAAAKEPLVRLRGRWTELETDDLQRALAFLDKKRRPAITIFEALRVSYLADDLDTGLPIAPLKAHGWIQAILDASDPSAPVDPVNTPAGFHGTLRDYQLKGLQWLAFLAKHGLGACLADDMGLGKTIQFIALLLLERERADAPGPTLLIVPMSLVGNWQHEVARFAPSLKVMVHHGLERLTGQKFAEAVADCDLVISTYGLVPRDLEHLIEIDWHRVALDEAQKTKNPAARQSQAIRMLRARQRVALTGTPVENRLSELWSIMDFLNRGYLGTVQEFRRKFAVPIERYHDAQRSERLRNLIRPFVLRRRKNDPGILDELPEKLERTVFCNLTPEQAALYEAVVNEMLGHIDTSGGIQRRGLILATLVKLKQICNHPAQFLRESGTLAHRSGKCDRITEMLEEVVAEGHRALVFTQFRQMGHLLQRHLQHTLGIKVLFLHGGTSQPERTAMVDTFQRGGDEPVFILSLRAGGFGLNLTAANHVFLFDRWWNPAVEDQAADRAHRIGQRKQVQVHKFVCGGTLEERIADLIESKRALAENIVGGGEGWLTELSTDALRDILKLSQEAVMEDCPS